MTVITKLSLIQFIFTLLITSLVVLVWNELHAMSAFLGGIICVVANLFFAGKLFLSKHFVQPEEILQNFYRSEVMKLVFTVTMFVLIFVLVNNLKHASFIIAYSLVALLNLVCLPFLKS